MIFICHKKCHWRNKLWQVGETYEGTKADEVPKHFHVSTKEVDIDDERELLLLQSQCDSVSIPYDKSWNCDQLEKALGVGVDPFGVERKSKSADLRRQLEEKGIEFDLRYGPEKLQQLLDGKEAKSKPRRKKHGKSGEKRKVSNRKSKGTLGSGNGVSAEGQEAP